MNQETQEIRGTRNCKKSVQKISAKKSTQSSHALYSDAVSGAMHFFQVEIHTRNHFLAVISCKWFGYRHPKPLLRSVFARFKISKISKISKFYGSKFPTLILKSLLIDSPLNIFHIVSWNFDLTNEIDMESYGHFKNLKPPANI